ncbi:TPA: phage tail protein [Salmonella enterica subsp. enterica serovar Mississippi]|uniref:phage tail protein n=1 Tax=Salmonella enterica TaxID=28901 RepID=UPI001EE87B53|nr:phage tail protein [Salmonella enterica]ULA44379.1 phage tail protein [Salmonella enterica]UNN13579.1 phage tail protein [Salmonella enterica]UNN17902.1 phage tail protein [Salmonella enterica]UNN22217.1 phage tail protein [Salmonella enterica]
MDKLIFTITDAGRQAIINASNTGTEKVEIKSVGIGSSYYITSPEQTDIHDEIKRITSIGGAVISPDTIHVSAKDNSPDEYVVHTVGLYTDKNILFAVYSRRMPIINKSSATVMLISSDITFKSLDTANITFGDVVFINPPASESVVGVSRFATAEEVEEGLDPAIAVSAKRLKGELDKKANLDSPNLTGTPTAPTTAESDNSQKIATTAFIKQVLLAYAKLASPNFTGKPTAPTADQSSNDTQLATTAFVRSAIAALVDSSPGALDTLNELAAALGDDPNFATTMTNALAGKQPLDGTLTNLSGKDVPALLQYLGLGETINLAASALQKSQNGSDIPDKGLFAQNIGAALAFSGGIHIGGDSNPWTTAEFIAWLESQGAFNHRYWMCRGSWSYADNKTITDTGCGNICLAGAVVEVMGFRGAMTIRVTTPTTTSGGGVASAQFTYINNGGDYSPGWRRDYNTINKPTAGDVGALPVTGGRLNGPLGIGTDNALGGNSIVLGDNDTGFKQDGDGILGIYANNARVGYIDNSGLHLSVDVLTNGGIRAGDGKRLSLTSNNNSALTATFNLWGDPNRPTVIELDDDQGWHLYSQRNHDGSIVFTVNGDITANTLRAGGAIYQNNGDIFGSLWGNGWLSTWIHNNVVKAVRLGPVALSGGLWRDFQLGGGQVVTGFHTDGSWEMEGGDDKVYYRPIQYLVGETWVTAPSV